MKKLGFDIDGVLYPWTDVAYEYLSQIGKINMPREVFWEDQHTYINSKLYWENLASDPILLEVRPPDRGVVSMLRRLSEHYEISYVSFRPASTKRVTQRYLEKYKYPSPENLYLTVDKKSTVRQLELDIFVEDTVPVCESIQNICKTFIVTQSYNMKYSSPRVTRLNHILELERYI
jgi:uncharacterized HAD superfamily protein